MSSSRMRRVDEAVRAVLSEAITQELKDPRVGFVTVTAVETAPDLRRARVFVSVLGDDAVRKRSMAGLQSAHGVLQRVVARELRRTQVELRRAPDRTPVITAAAPVGVNGATLLTTRNAADIILLDNILTGRNLKMKSSLWWQALRIGPAEREAIEQREIVDYRHRPIKIADDTHPRPGRLRAGHDRIAGHRCHDEAGIDGDLGIRHRH